MQGRNRALGADDDLRGRRPRRIHERSRRRNGAAQRAAHRITNHVRTLTPAVRRTGFREDIAP